MFALTGLCTAATLGVAATNIFNVDRAEARALRVRPARLVGHWICAPDARRPTCVWQVNEAGSAGGLSSDWLRAA
jgi:hypothetical protein